MTIARRVLRWLSRGPLRRRLGWFTVVVAGAWLLAAGPAYLLDGTWGILGSAISAILCLLPGWIVLYASDRLEGPKGLLFAVLVATVLRPVLVLGGGLAVYYGSERFGVRNLLLWLVALYFVTLALETATIVSSRQQ